jgi:hypothetical protein
MRIKPFASILALLLLSLAAPLTASAQSADGSYQFSLEDGYTKYVEFTSRALSGGGADGQMFFSDEAEIVYQDVDGTGEKEESYRGVSIQVEFDGMVIDKNQAVMSGTIRDATIGNFIGQRVLLTVQDNGDNTKEPDRLTWGIYRPVVRNWIPSDAEWKEDPGVGLTWLATDAERRDDEGVKMPRNETINAQSFPVSTYAFVDMLRGAGDIRVLP